MTLASSSRSGELQERTLGVARLTALFVLFLIGAAAQEPYCAFEVLVRDSSAVPVTDVPVGLLERGSQVATVWSNAQGIARLCDAPLRSVDIVVGANSCASGVVLVKNVRPTWPTTRRVIAVYSPDPCNEYVFPAHCQLLFRVHDQNGHAITGARFEGVPSIAASTITSDGFGRIYGSLGRGVRLAGSIIREGYEPGTVSEECAALGSSVIERKVTLQKK